MTGSELRARRLRAGCSRDQLAHSVGVPVETISEWEGEETPIRCPVAVEVVLRDAESRRVSARHDEWAAAGR